MMLDFKERVINIQGWFWKNIWLGELALFGWCYGEDEFYDLVAQVDFRMCHYGYGFNYSEW